jgi:uncharacterized membrane protein YczE
MSMEKLRLINSMKTRLRDAALTSNACEASMRDGLMTGCQRLTGLAIAWVRVLLEVTVITLG